MYRNIFTALGAGVNNMSAILDEINRLANERHQLYVARSNGALDMSDAEFKAKIDELTRKLERLWDQRREELAGKYSEGFYSTARF